MNGVARALDGLVRSDVEVVVRRIGGRITDIRPTRWGWATPGASVRLASGTQLVIQRRPAAEAERVAAAIDALRAAGVPVPRLLMRVHDGADDLVAFGHVGGEVAAVHLGKPGGDAIARLMGAALVAIRATAPAGIPLDPAWTGPATLAEAVPGWVSLVVTDPRLAALAAAATDAICAVPWSPVASHGDYVPVNALFDGGALTAILDLGDVALRHPLIDPAWWSLVVGHHHPGMASQRRAFLTATGLRTSERELAAIAVLRGLQLAATTRQSDRPSERALLESAVLTWAGT